MPLSAFRSPWRLCSSFVVIGALHLSACLPPEQDDDDDGAGESGLPSTTTTTATTTNVTTTTPGISGFLPDVDNTGEFECSVWQQDCLNGQKCMPWAWDGGSSWNATRCVPIDANAGQPGDQCAVINSGTSGEDTCASSSMCWGVDPETNLGTCVAFCTGSEVSPSCADPSTACSIANDGALVLCLPTCDPLEQNCGEREACYGIDDAFVCAPDASLADQGTYGDPCEFINACRPGLGCFNGDGVPGCQTLGCCSPFCDISQGADAGAACPGAASGQECVPYFEEGEAPRAELADIGVCFIPA